MKTGIVTFQNTNNYGALLQNFALQQAVSKLGHIAETINYKDKYISKPYGIAHLKNKGLFAYLFGVLGYIIYLPRTKKCKEFKQKIKYSVPLKKENLKSLNSEYDNFIAGSDQVWNYKLTGLDDAYLMDFVEDKSKCNSYAASLGFSELEENKRGRYINNLSSYNIITVREKAGETLLRDILKREVETVVDPCLLLSYDEWQKVIIEPKTDKHFILVYQLGFSPVLVEQAVKVAKRENKKIVFLPFPVGKPAFGKYDVFAGPSELLGYIKKADYVFTDSFHGTLFSILFNKQFYTKISGTHAGIGSRISDMLAIFGLEKRLVEYTDLNETIDFENINPIITIQRERSLKILNKIYEGEATSECN